MTSSRLARSILAAGALSSVALPLLAVPALAQPAAGAQPQDIDPRAGSYMPPDQRGYQGQQGYPQQGYQGQPVYQGQQDRYPNGAPMPDQRGYPDPQGTYANGAPMPEPAPPPGYDGTRPPPPPPGYQPYADERARVAADDRYAADAERWARENCVKSSGDVAGGALLGGLLGAIIGSSVAGRHDRGAGAFAGAAIGAVGGAAVASSGNGETSPGCPPGYRVRREAVTYSYRAPDYYYAAPGWYRPWVYIGGAWTYRPYPYHDWYYRTYRARPYSGYGYRGYGGYRGGPEPWRGGHGGWEHRRGW
ncbi:MAG: hypothetical protein KGM17_00950 [Sphingomonadales bacterium]|nr:hypothetical protein [Sphingomonadales bacterium]